MRELRAWVLNIVLGSVLVTLERTQDSWVSFFFGRIYNDDGLPHHATHGGQTGLWVTKQVT